MKKGEKPIGITTMIKVSSRASVKIKDNFYTIEYGEERSIPEGCDIEEERQNLWDTCNSEVDKQIEDIVKTFK